MKLSLLMAATLLSATMAQAKPNFCAGEVKASAAKLVALHYEMDQDMALSMMDDQVTELPSLRSPDKKRRYTVLETNAYPGKMGSLRVRMIYAILGNSNPKQDCILMGQEILDMSSL
jgi:hypothetical protein